MEVLRASVVSRWPCMRIAKGIIARETKKMLAFP